MVSARISEMVINQITRLERCMYSCAFTMIRLVGNMLSYVSDLADNVIGAFAETP